VACGNQPGSDDDDDDDDNNVTLFKGAQSPGSSGGAPVDSSSCTAACEKLDSCGILAKVEVSTSLCQSECEQNASSEEVSYVQNSSCTDIEKALGTESGGGEYGGGESGGGESGGGESGGGESGGGESGGSSFTCCLDGLFFDCPDATAFQQCASEWDPAMCQRDAARDEDCYF